MAIIKGIGASPGIAIGRALVIKKQVAEVTGAALRDEDEIQSEIAKFKKAVQSSVDEVEVIKHNLLAAGDESAAEILETQIELLQDEQIKDDVIEKIAAEKKNANDAVIEVIDGAVEIFSTMKDEYFSARAADVQDAGDRILKHINKSFSSKQIIPENTIIIAKDIAPTDTVTMDITRVCGFATQAGGKTSHAAIIARAKDIAAVVGCGSELTVIQNDDIVIVDGLDGTIIVNPSAGEVATYTQKKKELAEKAALLKKLKNVKAITRDEVAINLFANIANAADMEDSLNYGAEGSGLLRTELLFMGRDALPTEDEQFEFYKNVALKANGKPVIVRTLDIGGDKHLPYFNLPAEQNPFLGYRAIRICLDRKDIFAAQLKAILRASVFGDLAIMFPMISNVQELRQAKQALEEAKQELSTQQVAFNTNIQVGIMIEIPSAAVTADILAKEVDFFSIGTNDLCQYTLAVDRMSEQVKHLYDPFNPGVLRLIQNVIDQGNKHKIHTGMCGEMAGDTGATLLLLGMGLTDFSMSASAIPYVKNIINNASMATARQICADVMAMSSSQDIINYLQQVTKQ